MTDNVDPHVASAQRAVEAARVAKLAAAPPAWYADALAAHAASTRALDEAKMLCEDDCAHPPEADAETIALAQLHHSAHRGVQEAAYAEFARTGHALNPETPQAPSNPAGSGVTQIAAATAVNADVAS